MARLMFHAFHLEQVPTPCSTRFSNKFPSVLGGARSETVRSSFAATMSRYSKKLLKRIFLRRRYSASKSARCEGPC
jgi:hypothetical protein